MPGVSSFFRSRLAGVLFWRWPFWFSSSVFVKHSFSLALGLHTKGISKRDLQYRGFRDDRIGSFVMKQRANFLLRTRVLQCTSDEEFEMYRQSWDTINRPKYANKK